MPWLVPPHCTPTSGGDLNLPQAVGQYVPGSGTLLLVRVTGADASGAGGFPVTAPQGAGPGHAGGGERGAV